MPEVRIDATPRSEFGKGPARQVRREGRVPAVLYGHGTDPRHVTLPGHDVLLALRALIEPEGPASGRLAGRLGALCALPDERAKEFLRMLAEPQSRGHHPLL